MRPEIDDRNAPLEETEVSSPDNGLEAESEEPRDIIYLKEDDGSPKGRKKSILKIVQLLLAYGIPIMCLSLAIVGRFRMVFVIATIIGVQGVYLRYRVRRFTGPLIDDDVVRSRITPPLKELCTAAGLAPPQVQVKRTVVPAAMGRVNGLPTLWMSPDLLRATDDSELRAIISHEVTHLRYDLPPLTKKRGGWLSLGFTVGWFILAFATDQLKGILIYIAIYLAFLLPCLRVVGFFAGFSKRKRETRADVEGAAAINNPEAMIKGLRAVRDLGPDIRRRIYGPRALRWMWFPYSLPSTIHPPLKKRVAELQAMSVPATLAAALAYEPVKAKRFPIVGRLLVAAIVLTLVFLVLHASERSGISPNVESPGGAHFIPLNDLGLLYSIYGFAPLSQNQQHDDFITAKQAISDAENTEGVHPENGVSLKVAEGNVKDASLSGDGFFSTPLSKADWQPAYILVFSGPKLSEEGFTGGPEEVVLINAYQGSVLNAFIVSNFP